MNTVTTSYKHNGVPVSIPRGSYGVTRLTARLYEYPKGIPAGGALLLYGLPFRPVCSPAERTAGASGTI